MPNAIFRAAGKTSDFIVLQSSPVLKGKAREFGRGYAQFRILEVERGCTPAMGGKRARGVVRVVSAPRPVYYGEGVRSEGARVLKELREMAVQLAAKS